MINKLYCSICGLEHKIETGPNFFFSTTKNICICHLCISDLYNFVPKQTLGNKIESPAQIISFLKQHVFGQDSAIDSIAIAIFKHFLYINKKIDLQSYRKIKGNSLIIGPTGTGKTYMIELLCELLDIPMAIVDASSLTAYGYVGNDPETAILKLYKEAKTQLKTEYGIIVFDEVDKITRRENNNHKDVGGEAVQQEMLKMIEGSDMEIYLENRRYQLQAKVININTSGILFFGLGAFEGLDVLLGTNMDNEDGKIYFGASLNNKVQNRMHAALVKYGFLPEFIGRFTSIVRFSKLTKETILIIVKQKNGIVQIYKRILISYGLDINVTDEAYEEIAIRALSLKTGARGVYNIVNKIFEYLLHKLDIYQGRLVIDEVLISEILDRI